MIKFNDTSIYAGYIKQLLHSFNLPQCHIGYEEDFKNNLVGLNYIDGNSLYYCFVDSVTSTETHKRLRNYKFGDYIRNITKNLEIRNNYYDTYTHEYLGDYLRYLRDYTGLDLMSMYNCFSNNTIKSVEFSFQVAGRTVSIDSESKEYNVFVVPVRYGKKYTIALDWHGSVELFSGLYSDGFEIHSDIISGQSGTEFYTSTYQKESGTRFNHPFIYDKLVNTSRDYSNEKYLKLFIKVSSRCKSSIVVLEGDYVKDTELDFNTDVGKATHLPRKLSGKFFLYKPEDDLSDTILCSLTGSTDFAYRTKHQLLQMNTGENYMLADRLVEYLSNNAITQNDEIVENIRRLQLKLYYDINKNISSTFKYNPKYFGIWDEDIRKALCVYIEKYYLNSKYQDVLSYLDKDIEQEVGDFDTLKNLPKDKEKEEISWHLEE